MRTKGFDFGLFKSVGGKHWLFYWVQAESVDIDHFGLRKAENVGAFVSFPDFCKRYFSFV